ncbi:membrane protein [Streptomyces amakusaensis]|uniref:Secreted protein n=1 Tax=Streptomyces amakusaensis TaxID=67271 RepID=A0ABW0ALA5_9ACTN
MLWPMLAVALGFLGIAVLGLLGIRVFVEARRLGLEVARTTERINRAAEDLERAATGLARTGETLRP